MLRGMTRIEQYATKRSVKWPAFALLGFLALALLVALGPILMLAAGILLVIAWRMPERVAPYLAHRWLAGLPSWRRAHRMVAWSADCS